jgi:uncharacterized membrane protein YeaQ/YmgE (transglycosylase-associated protein family)
MVVNVLLWCLFGLVAGAVAQFIMPGRDPGQTNNVKGYLITTAIGIVGALVGGFISSRLFDWDVTGFNLASFGIAVAGALLLLVVYRLVAAPSRNVA